MMVSGHMSDNSRIVKGSLVVPVDRIFRTWDMRDSPEKEARVIGYFQEGDVGIVLDISSRDPHTLFARIASSSGAVGWIPFRNLQAAR